LANQSVPDRVLSGVGAICAHLYGTRTPSGERRIRHLIRLGIVPTKWVGGRHEARTSWLDSIHSEPDPPRYPPPPDPEPAAAAPDLGECALPGCTNRVLYQQRTGRPPKYCPAHGDRRFRRPLTQLRDGGGG
jgi:hypothetical protein